MWVRVPPRALVLTYHAIEAGPAPLCLDPGLFRRHLDLIAAHGARCLTVSQLAEALRAGGPAEPCVALTFDDGAASVVRTAAPLMGERGLVGTVFCVAGHLGGRNDWRSEPARSPRLRLADVGELERLAAAGWEVGSHGVEHVPLRDVQPSVAEREVAESRRRLEQALGRPVASFAYPFGLSGDRAVRELVGATYAAACLSRPGYVEAGDPMALPRVDAHYLRRPGLLERALDGAAGPYLLARRAGARARRLLVADHA